MTAEQLLRVEQLAQNRFLALNDLDRAALTALLLERKVLREAARLLKDSLEDESAYLIQDLSANTLIALRKIRAALVIEAEEREEGLRKGVA